VDRDYVPGTPCNYLQLWEHNRHLHYVLHTHNSLVTFHLSCDICYNG
jgi:hypothetical protein